MLREESIRRQHFQILMHNNYFKEAAQLLHFSN